MDTILKYWPVILVAINLLVAWVAWSFRQGIPSHSDVKGVASSVADLQHEFESRLDIQDDKVIRLEEAIKRAPTHDDITNLTKQIGELRGDLREAIGSLNGISRAVDLMNDHLLNSDKRS